MNMLDNVAHNTQSADEAGLFPPKHILPLPLEHILCISLRYALVSVYIAKLCAEFNLGHTQK